MGRLMVITRHQAMASSYDCNTCMCPLVFDGSVQVDPGSTHLLPTWYGYLSCFGEYEDCNYNRQWYQETSVATWSSGDTGVATIDASDPGRIEGISAGSTIISAAYSDCGAYYPPLSGQYSCTCGQIKYSNPSSGGDVEVQKPQFLLVVGDSCSSFTCPSGYGNSNVDQRFYRVLDVNGNPINIAGLSIAEQISLATDTCNLGSARDSGTWSTDANGIMTTPDYLWICFPNGYNCYQTYNQHFTVDSYPVLVTTGLQNGLTGSHNVIQFTASNGNGACPTIYPSP